MKVLTGLFLLIMLTASCGAPRSYEYHLQNLTNTEEGTIYLETTGIGNSENMAYNNAADRAFTALLFKGIPGSMQPMPMIDDEEKAKGEHKKIMDCFSSFDCYSKFITSSEKVGVPKNEGRAITVDLKIKIDLRALRSYLEQNNVIRHFGL